MRNLHLETFGSAHSVRIRFDYRNGSCGLGEMMVRFWSDSAIIGFYTTLKITVAGKWIALLAAPYKRIVACRRVSARASRAARGSAPTRH